MDGDCMVLNGISGSPCPTWLYVWRTNLKPNLCNVDTLAVSRIKARGDLYEMDLVVDVNIDLYPVHTGDKLVICLSPTLNLDGTAMPTGAPGQQAYDTVRVPGVYLMQLRYYYFDGISSI